MTFPSHRRAISATIRYARRYARPLALAALLSGCAAYGRSIHRLITCLVYLIKVTGAMLSISSVAATCEYVWHMLRGGGTRGSILHDGGLLMQVDEHTMVLLGKASAAESVSEIRTVRSAQVDGMYETRGAVAPGRLSTVVVSETSVCGQPCHSVSQPVSMLPVSSGALSATLRCPFRQGETVATGDKTVLARGTLDVMEAAAHLYLSPGSGTVCAQLCDERMSKAYESECLLTVDGKQAEYTTFELDPNGEYEVMVRPISKGAGEGAGTFELASGTSGQIPVRVLYSKRVAPKTLRFGRHLLRKPTVHAAVRPDIGVCIRLSLTWTGLLHTLPSMRQLLEAAYESWLTREVWVHYHIPHSNGRLSGPNGGQRGLFAPRDRLFQADMTQYDGSSAYVRWSKFACGYVRRGFSASTLLVCMRVPVWTPSFACKWHRVDDGTSVPVVAEAHPCANICAAKRALKQFARDDKFDLRRLRPPPTVADELANKMANIKVLRSARKRS